MPFLAHPCVRAPRTLPHHRMDICSLPRNVPSPSPCSRQYFDQDRGAEFLRRVSITRIDSEVLARYTVLGAAFALLKYIESTTAMTFPRASVKLHFIDSNAADSLTIDRRTAMGLEILSNARSGDQKNCLFGKIDHTKVRSIQKPCDKLVPPARRCCPSTKLMRRAMASPRIKLRTSRLTSLLSICLQCSQLNLEM